MIFVAIALLAVAAIALGIGIAASAVPPLVVSVLCTLAAGGTLWASFVVYRKEAAEQGETVTGLGGNAARQPGYPDAYAAPGSNGAVPHGVAPAPVAPVMAAAPAPTIPAAPAPAVPEGWDDLLAGDARDMVDAFNLDELHAIRRHEVEHANRKTVLAAIDARVDHLVGLRRKLNAG